MTTLSDRIVAAIENYPEWSPAERQKLHIITEEILAHVRDGSGNRFIRLWCEYVLQPVLDNHEVHTR